VQTLEGHSQNVCVVAFHPELPLIVSGSEDGTVRLWHSNTYRLENTLNYGFERVWTLCQQRGSNCIGIGYDEGTVVIKVCLLAIIKIITIIIIIIKARSRRSRCQHGHQWQIDLG
jgi:WD40 repeat protein